MVVFFAFGDSEAKNPGISAAEWLRARLQPPCSLRFCDAIFVPLSCKALVRGVSHKSENCSKNLVAISFIFKGLFRKLVTIFGKLV